MKDPGAENNRAAQLSKINQLATVSERKRKANRENAKKSTGPKTPRGKAFSCRNALKHGLFVREATDFEALFENPQEFQRLLNGLWEQYRPIGKAEEVEVERIALCWWRLKRAWRHENAVNLAARRDFVRPELEEQEAFCNEQDKEDQAILVELQNARRDLQEKGEVSQEVKQRIFGLRPRYERMLTSLEKFAETRMKELGHSKKFGKLAPQVRAQILSTYAVNDAIASLEGLSDERWTNVVEVAVGGHAIPNGEALDKILRYEAAFERQLGRAVDRLERMQRRRIGEMILPPVSVRLTR
jgi:hypothetical protein